MRLFLAKIYIRNLDKINSLNEVNNTNTILEHELNLLRLKEKDQYRRSKRGFRLRNKKNKKQKQNARRQRLERFSNDLEDSLPKSEKWFREKYLKESLNRIFKEDSFTDKFNKPYNDKYIPDIHNAGYRYVIEVDGSWHDRIDAKIKDFKKNHYFDKRGFLLIRVIAYDDKSYEDCITKLKEHIEAINIIETERRKNRRV